MSTKGDLRLVELLSRAVEGSRVSQDEGHLRDPVSRMEVALLKHQLAVATGRLTIGQVRAGSTLGQRSWTLVILAQEACAAARALRPVQFAVHEQSRAARRHLYRLRLIHGPG